ncbi:ABC transporter ATP-binding protein [Ruania halotolerans]|uniref:ABC transporter ATP-binding protein n=1 Tax=Ruania halotolerans TaxID=2897773 RepID=UPI001E3E15B6|nr:ATP-binding cassette domain-containing protein [Ruania halotolerans]UFU08039.1 ATP-binding cassette domain-containing protein [Ruania halotolerans]
MPELPTEPIVEFDRLSFRYPGAEQDALRNVTASIPRGDFVAVIGGNGAAKTTLCKAITGLIPHYWDGEFAGAVRVAGQDTWETDASQLASVVGYVAQDFQNQLVRPTVRDEVAFGPLNFGHADYRERTDEALELLGLTEIADRFVWQLSGGQAHLTALAAVLALRPQVLIVDEPVAEVDPARAGLVYEKLRVLNAELGITVITIEHHVEFVARYARSVLLMAEGRPVWHLPVEEAMARSDELARYDVPPSTLVAAVRAAGEQSTPRTVAEAADLLAGRSWVRSPPPDAASSDRRSSGLVPGTPVATSSVREPVATFASVSHAYRGVDGSLLPVLREVDLELYEGEQVALVGGNGAGKSTLLRILAGIVIPRAGQVRVRGTDTAAVSAAVMARQVAYLAQHPAQMFLTGQIRDDIALFPSTHGYDNVEAATERILGQVRLREHADRDGRLLSGGQQRRATIGIGLGMRPHLLLLDEPTASLDTRSRDDVVMMLRELAASVSCAVVASHDMDFVAAWADRVIVLGEGRILADVSPAELFADAALLTAAHLVAPQLAQLGTALGLSPPPLTLAQWSELMSAGTPEGMAESVTMGALP